MKKFKLFFCVLGLSVLGAIGSNAEECTPYAINPEGNPVIMMHMKSKWFSNNCKVKCDHTCNTYKRDWPSLAELF